MPNIIIDGREVAAEQGTTLVEAARAAGIEFPDLCVQLVEDALKRAAGRA